MAETVDGSSPSLPNEALVGQSAISSPPTRNGSAVDSEIEKEDEEPMDNQPSTLAGRGSSSSSSSLISSNMSNSCKSLDGFLPDGCTESVAISKSVETPGGPLVPSNAETPDAELSMVTLPCPNGSSLDDQSLALRHVGTLDYDSVVSLPSTGRGSSRSSLDERSYAPMQVELNEGPSSMPGMVHRDGRDLDDGDDNFDIEDDGRTSPCGYRYYHQREGYLFNSSRRCFPCSITGWDSSIKEREAREDMPPSFSFLMQETGPTGVGAGLSNLGNTCFINAILQCFTHTVSLVKALRSSNHMVPCGAEGFCIHCALFEHIELSLASSGKVVSPVKLFDNLNYISSSFQRYYQEDAHEFLQCLLDRLERCLLDSRPSGEARPSVEDNIVELVFGGRLVSKLRCCNCGHCSNKYEALIDLSLEIEDVGTLQWALESFTKVEKLEGSEAKLMCENCNEEASREKQLMLDRAPSVAIMHLKRFKTDGLSIEKIGKHVDFPLELNLKPYTICSEDGNVDLKYQLYAVVVHDGLLPTSGHYFCYVRSSPDTWHKLDDSMVIKVEEEFVLSQAAYILFYAREDTPWFSGLIDTQKIRSNLRITNTSPKSVLENMDGECTLDIGMTNAENGKGVVNEDAADGTLITLSSGKLFERKNGEILDEAVGVTEQISCGTSKSEQNLCCDESKDGVDPMIVVSEPHGLGECHDAISYNEKLSVLPSVDENNCNQASNRIIGNGLHPAMPSQSLHPITKVGPSGVRDQIPHHHLKADNRISFQRHSTRAGKLAEIEEALRYAKRNMPSLRSKEIMNLMLGNDKKRRLSSSPCTRASPPGSCGKSICHVAVLR